MIIQMRRWHIQLKAVQTLHEELSSFGANLHPSPTELVGKCLLKLRKFSQQTQRVISIAEQPAEASSQSSSSGGKRAASATNSNEIHEVSITEGTLGSPEHSCLDSDQFFCLRRSVRIEANSRSKMGICRRYACQFDERYS
jgi:hypothetical protein